jgi:uncharacterized protein (UPF0332 family)
MNQEQSEKLELAEEKIAVAKLLLRNDKLQDAISRAYYGMFHAAKGMLLEKESEPKTHSATASELGKLFREELGTEMTREFSRIKDKREKADYGELRGISREETDKIIETAEKFVKKAESILED